MTHYDVTMDISSNIITDCDVIMGHGTKSSVHNVITEKVVLTTESPPEIWVWRFRSKQAVVQHNIVYLESIILNSPHPGAMAKYLSNHWSQFMKSW